jgi:hypothetical protein
MEAQSSKLKGRGAEVRQRAESGKLTVERVGYSPLHNWTIRPKNAIREISSFCFQPVGI